MVYMVHNQISLFINKISGTQVKVQTFDWSGRPIETTNLPDRSIDLNLDLERL